MLNNRYYKDRDFPEIKVSNAEIVAVVPNLQQLQRLIIEHNILLEVVQFYASPLTWVSNSGKVGVSPIDADKENIPGLGGAPRWCGGKFARETLKS